MMRTLPTTMLHLLNPFVPLFSRGVCPQVQVLLAGAFPQLPAREPSVQHCESWASGNPNTSNVATDSSTALLGQAGRRVVCC